MIEIYNDCKDKEATLPQPLLKLSVEGKCIRINAVDENGKTLAYIWSNNSTTKFVSNAKNALYVEGHSTDWANWNDNGSFKSLT